jgi:glycosyltransferase involved in cell wall biosynthesis
VTIVIAAWNEEDVIDQTLGRIARLSYPELDRSRSAVALRVLVIDDEPSSVTS